MSLPIILHHYDVSPFSEKPRLLFGLRGFAWRSVIQPTIMPKPDLIPLTGGYRRAPVMQIGADIYCDSQVIMAEIERRADSRGGNDGLGWAVNLWADRLFFPVSVAVIFGEIGASIPKAFIEDREKLFGRPFDIAAMKAAEGPMRGQWRALAGWIESALSTGSPYLQGDTPGIADIAAYMNIWFMTRFAPHLSPSLLTGFNQLEAWADRVAAIGHGEREEMGASEALSIAKSSEPSESVAHDSTDPLNLAPGAKVSVSADDYGRDPIAGFLVAANRERVVIARDDKDVGRLHVHFPRVGYLVTASD